MISRHLHFIAIALLISGCTDLDDAANTVSKSDLPAEGSTVPFDPKSVFAFRDASDNSFAIFFTDELISDVELAGYPCSGTTATAEKFYSGLTIAINSEMIAGLVDENGLPTKTAFVANKKDGVTKFEFIAYNASKNSVLKNGSVTLPGTIEFNQKPAIGKAFNISLDLGEGATKLKGNYEGKTLGINSECDS